MLRNELETDEHNAAEILVGKKIPMLGPDVDMALASADKAECLAKGFKYLHHFGILTDKNQKLLVSLSLPQLQLLSVFGSQQHNPDEHNKMIAQSILDSLPACEFPVTVVEQSGADRDWDIPAMPSNEPSGISVRIEDLRHVLALHTTLQTLYKNSLQNPENNSMRNRDREIDLMINSESRKQLQFIAQSPEETTPILTIDQLYELAKMTVQVGNPKYNDDAEAKPLIFAIKKEAQDARLAIKMFGSERAEYLKQKFLLHGINYNFFVGAFLIDPNHLDKLDDALTSLHAETGFDSYTLSDYPYYKANAATMKLLMPLVEAGDKKSCHTLARGLAWVRQFNLATPERLRIIQENPQGTGLLADWSIDKIDGEGNNIIAFDSIQKFAENIFAALLPHIIARQNEINANPHPFQDEIEKLFAEESIPPKPHVCSTPLTAFDGDIPQFSQAGYHVIKKDIVEYDETVRVEFHVYNEHDSDPEYVVTESPNLFYFNFIALTSRFLIYSALESCVVDYYAQIKIWDLKLNQHILTLASTEDYRPVCQFFPEDKLAYTGQDKILLFNLKTKQPELSLKYPEIRDSSYTLHRIVGEFHDRVLLHTSAGLLLLDNTNDNEKAVLYKGVLTHVGKLNNELLVCAIVHKHRSMSYPDKEKKPVIIPGETEFHTLKFDTDAQQFKVVDTWKVPHHAQNIILNDDGILFYQDAEQLYALDFSCKQSEPKCLWQHQYPYYAGPLTFSFSVAGGVLNVKTDSSYVFAENHDNHYKLQGLKNFLTPAPAESKEDARSSPRSGVASSIATHRASMWSQSAADSPEEKLMVSPNLLTSTNMFIRR